MIATAAREYVELLTETLPTAIHTEKENEAALRTIEKLMDRRDPAAKKLVDLLTVLVEAFEEEHYPVPRKVTPLEVLEELIETNNLKQKDLTDVFGTPSIVSEVLSGKRDLTVGHIKKLATRFHTSTDLFF